MIPAAHASHPSHTVFGTSVPGMIMLIGLALLSVAESTAAQEYARPLVQRQTTQGCLFWWGNFHGAGTNGHSEWVGSCTTGQPINGTGTLKLYSADKMFKRPNQLSGRLVDGYPHGPMTYVADGFTGANCELFHMGRFVKQLSSEPCTPGAEMASDSTASTTPAASAPPRPSPAPAQPLTAEMKARMKALLQRAERGDATAQTDLAFIHDRGVDGVAMNPAEAMRWYRRAAEQGNVEAREQLGGMYARGRGVPVDHAEAARWYRLAANQGSIFAQLQLADMYTQGRGVSRNEAEAVRLYKSILDHQPHERVRRDVAEKLRTLEQQETAQTSARERNLNDESRCITPDFSGKGMAGFENHCNYPVYVSFCNLDAPEKSFSSAFVCRTNNFGLEGVPAKGRVAALIVAGRVFWMACEKPATPSRAVFELGRGIIAQCRI